MKTIYIFAAVFFLAGLFSANAQDIIVLKDGNEIEAKVTEISQTEIRYKRFDNQDGPVIVIAKASVLSIRYENGAVEDIDFVQAQGRDREKLTFSLSIEPAGFVAGGPSATGEWIKNKLNAQFWVSFPTLVLDKSVSGFGMGAGFGLNYLYNTRLGGFYIGAMLEYNLISYSYEDSVYNPYASYDPVNDKYIGASVYETKDGYIHDFIAALNIGYRFETSSGIYFRTGVSAGGKLSSVKNAAFFYRPDAAAGYTF